MPCKRTKTPIMIELMRYVDCEELICKIVNAALEDEGYTPDNHSELAEQVAAKVAEFIDERFKCLE